MKTFFATLVIVLASFTTYATWGTDQDFGVSTDIAFPGDYTGDGKADLTVIRTNSNNTWTWYVLDSQTNTLTGYNWGQVGDEPIKIRGYGEGCGGTCDNIAVIRRNTSTHGMEWYFLHQLSGGPTYGYSYGLFTFGADTDTPVPADYSGDGVTDFAVRSGTYWDFR